MLDLDSRALRIVEACLDLEGAERDAFVSSRSEGCAELAARVRQILAMEAESDSLLSTRLIERRHGEADDLPERVGRFRITGLIGRGGMGMVVRAQRDDGVYAQDVAIKLIRAGLRGEVARERFANERRLLARLTHPAIARIIDGGEDSGRAWLAMELVEGRAITAELRARGAKLDAALRLFDRVAEAVSHAHRNLVIHGDIKPSNILVGADGGVKLLDFGIGRLAEQLDSEAVLYPLTPAYAAPERQGGEPPTVVADVFSLGVLLHEMLGETGVPADLDDDLRAIVDRAKAEDPAARYPDVAALQQDLASYDGFRPVSARPPSLRHSARLFLRRNRLAIAVATTFAVLLLAATLVSTSLYLEARRQRTAADQRFEQLRSLARFQLFDLYDRLAETPGTTAARARLAAEAQHYLDSLAAAPDVPLALRLDVAGGLDRLAAVQGVPRVPNLGQPAEARRNLALAAAILDPIADGAAADPEVAAEAARNRILRAQVATWIDFRTDAARRLLAAARIPDGLAPAESREIEAMRRSAMLDVLGWDEKYAALRAAADGDLAWLDRWPEPRSILWHAVRADALNARGDALYYLGDRQAALRDYQASEGLLAAALARWPRRSALLARQMISDYDIASTRANSGRQEGLVPFVEDLLRRGDALLELEPNDQALRRRQTLNRELAAQILDEFGRHAEALAQQRQVAAERATIAAANANEPRAIRDSAFSRSVLGTLAWKSGRRTEACQSWRVAEAGFAALLRSGRLSAFDREDTLAYVRRNLAICDNRLPASAYRAPG